MELPEIIESIKKLWTQGIVDASIIASVLGIASEQYEEAIQKIKLEYSDYNRDSFWSKFTTQIQNRYVEIEEIKDAAFAKNKHQVALECIKAKAELDIHFLTTAQTFGILDKGSNKIAKTLSTMKLGAAQSIKQIKGDMNDEYDDKNISSSS